VSLRLASYQHVTLPS